MKKLSLFLLFSVGTLFASAQIVEPVKCTTSYVTTGEGKAEIRFALSIDDGWHVYSTGITGGPITAAVTFETLEGAEAGTLTFTDGEEQNHFDAMFNMDVRYFEHRVTFVQPLTLTSDAPSVSGYFQYGACNDQNCLPPTNEDFSFGSVPQSVPSTAVVPSAPLVPGMTPTSNPSSQTPNQFHLLQEGTVEASASGQGSLWGIFLAGVLGGLLALVTPCVWPIIPMTVSFFLKRSKDKRRGRRDAYLYGASIVVIYVLLGLLITLIFGASALNALSTAAIPNLFFFLLLLVFGFSFLGAFELTLPSSWSTSVDGKAEKAGGVLGIFLMAFTLTLVSFSCTGPIIGFLLVEVGTTGNILGPTIGMLGFSLALALPFTLFAIFPAWLKSAPKSGGWMNTVKVVLAFVEIAFSLKFLSVADLAYGWGILSRPTFLALWIVLALLLGCYLLGWIRFKHDDEVRHVSVTRFSLAVISFAFALYMVPGLWGAPCKAISAFAPPLTTQDFNLYDKTVHAQTNDYDEAVQMARQQGRPIMIDFSGYGCVNCRKMEQSVLSDTRVADIINNRYVLVTLIVDDKTALPSPIRVDENGKTVTLRTVGDKWSYLQRSRFGANAQPFYVLVDADGNLLTAPRSYDEDVPAFLNFLQQGLKK